MRESSEEETTFIILYDHMDSRGSPVSTTSNGARNEQDVRRDVQAMEKFKRGSSKEKEKNDFHVAEQGEGREAIAEGEGMEEGRRSRKVLSLAADSATSDEAAPRCFERTFSLVTSEPPFKPFRCPFSERSIENKIFSQISLYHVAKSLSLRYS